MPTASPRHRSWPLVLPGLLALSLGAAVYLTDRQHPHASLGFGLIGAWLPAFVHPFAFSLFTAAVLGPSARPRYGACAAWALVNIAFELGQHASLKAPLADALHAHPGPSAPVRWLADYFLRGTFDVGDLLAIVLGALAAACLLHALQAPREPVDDR
ncbi:MAG: hypothetical protein ABJD97_00600 [Betaproteobacteria bacterium]